MPFARSSLGTLNLETKRFLQTIGVPETDLGVPETDLGVPETDLAKQLMIFKDFNENFNCYSTKKCFCSVNKIILKSYTQATSNVKNLYIDNR